MRKSIMISVTTLNAESAEQMHLTRLFPTRKEAGHARLGWRVVQDSHSITKNPMFWNQAALQHFGLRSDLDLAK